MAAIDKMYVNSFDEYNELRIWALIYYPKLLYYFYDDFIIREDWEQRMDTFALKSMVRAKNEYETKIGNNAENIHDAIANLREYYKNTSGYDCPLSQAEDETYEILNNRCMCVDDWKEKYSEPIMRTPFSVDMKLKWICPVRCVREYLHHQCGVNPRWEWLYSIFWKGKKLFN